MVFFLSLPLFAPAPLVPCSGCSWRCPLVVRWRFAARCPRPFRRCRLPRRSSFAASFPASASCSFLRPCFFSCSFCPPRFGPGVLGPFFGPLLFLWFAFFGLRGLLPRFAPPAVFPAFLPPPVCPCSFVPRLLRSFSFRLSFPGAPGAAALSSAFGPVGRGPLPVSWPFVPVALLLSSCGPGAWLFAPPPPALPCLPFLLVFLRPSPACRSFRSFGRSPRFPGPAFWLLSLRFCRSAPPPLPPFVPLLLVPLLVPPPSLFFLGSSLPFPSSLVLLFPPSAPLAAASGFALPLRCSCPLFSCLSFSFPPASPRFRLLAAAFLWSFRGPLLPCFRCSLSAWRLCLLFFLAVALLFSCLSGLPVVPLFRVLFRCWLSPLPSALRSPSPCSSFSAFSSSRCFFAPRLAGAPACSVSPVFSPCSAPSPAPVSWFVPLPVPAAPSPAASPVALLGPPSLCRSPFPLAFRCVRLCPALFVRLSPPSLPVAVCLPPARPPAFALLVPSALFGFLSLLPVFSAVPLPPGARFVLLLPSSVPPWPAPLRWFGLPFPPFPPPSFLCFFPLLAVSPSRPPCPSPPGACFLPGAGLPPCLFVLRFLFRVPRGFSFPSSFALAAPPCPPPLPRSLARLLFPPPLLVVSSSGPVPSPPSLPPLLFSAFLRLSSPLLLCCARSASLSLFRFFLSSPVLPPFVSRLFFFGSLSPALPVSGSPPLFARPSSASPRSGRWFPPSPFASRPPRSLFWRVPRPFSSRSPLFLRSSASSLRRWRPFPAAVCSFLSPGLPRSVPLCLLARCPLCPALPRPPSFPSVFPVLPPFFSASFAAPAPLFLGLRLCPCSRSSASLPLFCSLPWCLLGRASLRPCRPSSSPPLVFLRFLCSPPRCCLSFAPPLPLSFSFACLPWRPLLSRGALFSAPPPSGAFPCLPGAGVFCLPSFPRLSSVFSGLLLAPSLPVPFPLLLPAFGVPPAVLPWVPPALCSLLLCLCLCPPFCFPLSPRAPFFPWPLCFFSLVFSLLALPLLSLSCSSGASCPVLGPASPSPFCFLSFFPPFRWRVAASCWASLLWSPFSPPPLALLLVVSFPACSAGRCFSASGPLLLLSPFLGLASLPPVPSPSCSPPFSCLCPFRSWLGPLLFALAPLSLFSFFVALVRFVLFSSFPPPLAFLPLPVFPAPLSPSSCLASWLFPCFLSPFRSSSSLLPLVFPPPSPRWFVSVSRCPRRRFFLPFCRFSPGSPWCLSAPSARSLPFFARFPWSRSLPSCAVCCRPFRLCSSSSPWSGAWRPSSGSARFPPLPPAPSAAGLVSSLPSPLCGRFCPAVASPFFPSAPSLFRPWRSPWSSLCRSLRSRCCSLRSCRLPFSSPRPPFLLSPSSRVLLSRLFPFFCPPAPSSPPLLPLASPPSRLSFPPARSVFPRAALFSPRSRPVLFLLRRPLLFPALPVFASAALPFLPPVSSLSPLPRCPRVPLGPSPFPSRPPCSSAASSCCRGRCPLRVCRFFFLFCPVFLPPPAPFSPASACSRLPCFAFGWGPRLCLCFCAPSARRCSCVSPSCSCPWPFPVFSRCSPPSPALPGPFVLAGPVGPPAAVRALAPAGAAAPPVGLGPGPVCLPPVPPGFGPGGWPFAAFRWCSPAARPPFLLLVVFAPLGLLPLSPLWCSSGPAWFAVCWSPCPSWPPCGRRRPALSRLLWLRFCLSPGAPPPVAGPPLLFPVPGRLAAPLPACPPLCPVLFLPPVAPPWLACAPLLPFLFPFSLAWCFPFLPSCPLPSPCSPRSLSSSLPSLLSFFLLRLGFASLPAPVLSPLRPLLPRLPVGSCSCRSFAALCVLCLRSVLFFFFSRVPGFFCRSWPPVFFPLVLFSVRPFPRCFFFCLLRSFCVPAGLGPVFAAPSPAAGLPPVVPLAASGLAPAVSAAPALGVPCSLLPRSAPSSACRSLPAAVSSFPPPVPRPVSLVRRFFSPAAPVLLLLPFFAPGPAAPGFLALLGPAAAPVAGLGLVLAPLSPLGVLCSPPRCSGSSLARLPAFALVALFFAAAAASCPFLRPVLRRAPSRLAPLFALSAGSLLVPLLLARALGSPAPPSLL
ncbi:KUP/HAK/KT family potassium transporter, partial [Streptococcus agalactiae]|nr:KUP/HAK/KT family potassium transporter [Streptococcus agalactiae]